MTAFTVATLCVEYARLRCAARLMAHHDETEYAALLRDVSGYLLDEAPAEARADLDTVKRIMEIDIAIVDPTVVLLRASVTFDMFEQTRKPDPQP
jgi:hypothetical protein